MPTKTKTSEQPLRGHHTRLIGLFQDLVAEAKKNDRSKLRAMWTTFESALLAHINAEEAELIPLYRRAHPGKAAALLEDHAFFRESLTEFGVDLDLHLMRVNAVESFIRRLRDHAVSEDADLYAWAEQEVPRNVQERFRKAAEAVPLPPHFGAVGASGVISR